MRGEKIKMLQTHESISVEKVSYIGVLSLLIVLLDKAGTEYLYLLQ